MPAAGWYPNPENAAELRFWDGNAWTNNTAAPDAASSSAAPAVVTAAPDPTPHDTSAVSAVANWYPDPQDHARLRYWDGTTWTNNTAASGPMPADTPGFLGLHLHASHTGTQIADEYCGKLTARDINAREINSRQILAYIIFGFFGVVFLGLMLGGLVTLNGANNHTDPATRSGAAIAALVLLAVGFWAWNRRCTLVDVPSVEVAGAHVGWCEFTGTVETHSAPLLSWFSNTPCLKYSSELTRQQGKSTVTIWRHTDSMPGFSLKDASGEIPVTLNPEKPTRGFHFSFNRDWAEQTAVEHGVGGGVTAGEKVLPLHETVLVCGPVTAEDGKLVVRADSDMPSSWQRPITISKHSKRELGITYLLTALGGLVGSYIAAMFVLFTTTTTKISDTGPQQTLVWRHNLLHPIIILSAAAAVIILAALALQYWNRIVRLANQAQYSWSLIAVAAQKRHDLIGNLQQTTTAVASYETTTQVANTKLRTSSVTAADAQLQADAPLRATLEANPTLHTNENYSQMFSTLVSCENQLSAARKFYNDAVTLLANKSRAFPGMLFARGAIGGEIPPLLQFQVAGQ